MKNRKLWIVGAVALIILFAAAYAASPLLAAGALRSAAAAGDPERISRHVDFPSVRDSLKSQMNAIMMAQLTSDPEMKDNPFAGIALAMAPMMIQGAVDAYVTPDNLALMVQRGKAEPIGDRAPRQEPASSELKTSARYLTPDKFEYRIRAEGEAAEDSFALIFERRGLFTWKMVRLELPASAMPDKPTAP